MNVMKRKASNIVSANLVFKMMEETPLFTPLRQTRGVGVYFHSLLHVALNGGESSTLPVTTSHPGKEHQYPLN